MLLILTSFFVYFSVISFYIYSPVIGSTGDDDDIYCGETGGDCNGSDRVDQIGGSENYANNIDGGKGDDSIYGGKASDTIIGNDGNDAIEGDAGDDSLFGWKGDDSILGDEGSDDITGNEGLDTIHGGTENDHLYQNDHSNLPDGSPDKIYCDAGEDDFAYISESDGDIAGDGCEHIISIPQ